jgi:hypothetical protein
VPPQNRLRAIGYCRGALLLGLEGQQAFVFIDLGGFRFGLWYVVKTIRPQYQSRKTCL